MELPILERWRLLTEAAIAKHVDHLLKEAEPEVLVHLVPCAGEILCNFIWQFVLGVLYRIHVAKTTIAQGDLDVPNSKVVGTRPHLVWDDEGQRVHRIEAFRGLLVEDRFEILDDPRRGRQERTGVEGTICRSGAARLGFTCGLTHRPVGRRSGRGLAWPGGLHIRTLGGLRYATACMPQLLPFTSTKRRTALLEELAERGGLIG